MTIETAVEEAKQDQAVQPGVEEVVTTEAGTEEAVTAAAESDEFSIDAIMSDEAPKTDEALVKEDGISEKAQERINRKIGKAFKEKNIAKKDLEKANAEIAALKTAQATPTERPLAPLREDHETGLAYQEAMSKYQDDTVIYNAALNTAKTQETTDNERVQSNDTRLLSQMEELQGKFPSVDIEKTIMDISAENGFGNAAGLINDSEHNGRIALFLAKNEAERVRIGSLTDAGIINREIGKLEERFSKAQKKTTTAPAALNTIDNKTETVVTDINAIKNDDDWYKARQEKKKRLLLEKFKKT